MIDRFAAPSNARKLAFLGRREMRRISLFATAFALLGISSAFSNSVSAAQLPQIVNCEVGLGKAFKLGLTTQLIVEVQGGDEPMPIYVMVIAPDSDGVGASTTMLGGRPLSTEPGVISQARIYARIGKQDAPLQIRLFRGSKVIDKKTYTPYEEGLFEIPNGVNANHRIWLSIGAKSGLESVLQSDNEFQSEETLRIAAIESTEAMPLDWIGYEGIDTIWLATGDGKWIRDLGSNDPRMVALREWVESGGHLVLSSGSAGADLLGPGKPLSMLLPGEYEGIATLRRTTAIEAYAGAKLPINLRGGDLTLSRIKVSQATSNQARVEASEGGGENSLPLVVRKPYGFGEVTFVAFDLDSQALLDWPDRALFLKRLVTSDYKGLGNDLSRMAQSGYVNNDYESTNTVSALIAKLDSSFRGVSTTPFIAIVGLVIAYLLLIGPADYWFTVKWLKRPEVTWISFPLIVILTSVGAYMAATALKGDQLRVNQIDVIDVDVSAKKGRGIAITHLFSPQADRYSLALSVKQPGGSPVTNLQQYCSWLGKPGYGLGAMQGSNGMGVTLPADYQLQPLNRLQQRNLVTANGGAVPLSNAVANTEANPAADALVSSSSTPNALQPAILGMPVQVWSTKSLLSRWLGKVERSIESELLWNEDRLVEGTITNDFAVELTNCRLLAGDWAWRLGDLSFGETAEIDATLAPIKIATLLKGVDQGEEVQDYMMRLSLMGRRLNSNRELVGSHLAYCDIANQLAAGRALLLAECHDAPSCELIRDGDPLASDKDNHWVYCRFIMPIEEAQP